jgi:predicted alpha/beta hydrolase family esterase
MKAKFKNFSELDWIVVPGGPGLSAAYLKYGLAQSLENYKLHFYDPLTALCIDDLVNQILATAEKNKLKEYGLITHSFGNYLALRVLEKPNHGISGLLMLTPMPFTFQNWRLALQNITKKIPRSVHNKIQELSRQPNMGTKIFELLLPYYIARPVKIPANFI